MIIFFSSWKTLLGVKTPTNVSSRGSEILSSQLTHTFAIFFKHHVCARQQRRIRLEKIWLNFQKKIAFVAHKYHHKFLFNFLPPSSTVPKIFITTWKLKRVVFNYVRAKLQIFWNFIVAEFVSLDPLPYRWHAIIWIRFEVDYGNFIQWQILIVFIA